MRSRPESRIKNILNELDFCPFLKFEGIYQYCYHYPISSQYYNLRFYQDRTAIAAIVQGKRDKNPIKSIVKWFNKNDKPGFIGNYTIKGNRINFPLKTSSSKYEYNYDGVIEKDKIRLNTFYDPHRGDREKIQEYIFVPFNTL